MDHCLFCPVFYFPPLRSFNGQFQSPREPRIANTPPIRIGFFARHLAYRSSPPPPVPPPRRPSQPRPSPSTRQTPLPHNAAEQQQQHGPTGGPTDSSNMTILVITIYALVLALFNFENFLRSPSAAVTMSEIPFLAALRDKYLAYIRDDEHHNHHHYATELVSLNAFSYSHAGWWASLWASPAQYITYQFAHSGLMHFGACAITLATLSRILSPYMPARLFMAIYVAGGFFAANFDCAVDALTDPLAGLSEAQLRDARDAILRRWTREFNPRFGFGGGLFGGAADGRVRDQESVARELRRAQDEMEPYNSRLGRCLGSSSSLVCLSTIAAILTPRTRVSLLITPAFPLLYAVAGLALFDGACWATGSLPTLGHVGHLGGNVAGVLLWVLWLRRTPLAGVRAVLR
ncbi:MAG: hypothetical protein M1819_004034 [Sarea resinae]|nr:MAG: hypothetical protein M1819_004034 [Sarea resinae]